ncbi:MAG: hypothetical protein QOF48_2743 [Verrucomicrobiota bacterium]|jgi:hypothetical protein
MKLLITILVILAVCVGGWKLFEYWDKTNQDQEVNKRAADGADIQESDLPGLPYQLEQKYAQARQKGAAGVRDFLDAYGKAPKFQDPRKAWIELDYVVMIAGTEPVEAKKIFLDVKSRVRTNAPIYRRIRAMSKTFE